jgi:hypothetical protein
MFASWSRRGLGLFGLTVCLVLSVSSLLWTQRRCCEGDSWLGWTEEQRNDYVKAYIFGRTKGYSDACFKLVKYWPAPVVLSEDNNPLASCFKGMPDFAKGTEYFAKKITEFYRTYPENRILLITEILEPLAKGTSIQDVHQHPPFPAEPSAPPATKGATTPHSR